VSRCVARRGVAWGQRFVRVQLVTQLRHASARGCPRRTMFAVQSPCAPLKVALRTRGSCRAPASPPRNAALVAPRRARCSAAGRRAVRCSARGNGDDPRAPPKPDASEDFDADFLPGSDAARQWRALPADTRSLITAGVGFIAVPVVLSWSLRLAVIDPLIFFLQADLREFDLTPRQWNELTLELEGVERRLKYDALLGHAPKLSAVELDDRLREEGLLLEFQQRQRSREVRLHRQRPRRCADARAARLCQRPHAHSLTLALTRSLVLAGRGKHAL